MGGRCNSQHRRVLLAALTNSSVTFTGGEAARRNNLDKANFAKLTVATGSTSDTWDVPSDMKVIDWAMRPVDGDTYLVSFSRAVATNGRFTFTSTSGGSTIILWVWYN